jgi:hypothetical protein
MKYTSQTGLAKLIIILIVAILVISYFGINIQQIAESETGRANFGYVWSLVQKVWVWLGEMYQRYLAGYVGNLTQYFPNMF